MPKIILLSDLWGFVETDWQQFYLKKLNAHFEITMLDICVLANIDPAIGERQIHQNFLDGGIDLAVKKVLREAPPQSIVLGFSMGGYIGWKAIQGGFDAIQFYGISATRLRVETKSIACPIQLVYGENDPYQPLRPWFDQMNVDFEIVANKGHNLYREQSFAEKFCEALILKFTNAH